MSHDKHTSKKNSVVEGLEDAIAYAKGDKSRATEHKVNVSHTSAKTVDVAAINLRRADCCKNCKLCTAEPVISQFTDNDILYNNICSINGMKVTFDTICNRFERIVT